MNRFGSEYDDEGMEAARARHAADDRRAWREDQRATEQMWREGEARRRQEKWAQSGSSIQERRWSFSPLVEEDGRVNGWTAFLNGRKVGLVIRVRNDLVVITTSDDGGEVDVHYVRGSQSVSPDAGQIMAAFQQQLPEGARR